MTSVFGEMHTNESNSAFLFWTFINWGETQGCVRLKKKLNYFMPSSDIVVIFTNEHEHGIFMRHRHMHFSVILWVAYRERLAYYGPNFSIADCKRMTTCIDVGTPNVSSFVRLFVRLFVSLLRSWVVINQQHLQSHIVGTTGKLTWSPMDLFKDTSYRWSL